jgi:hypothetical protein
MNKRMLIGLIVVALLVIGSTAAQAVPSLGVATGSYIGDAACALEASYIDCFTGPYVSGSGEGFVIGPSGSDLFIFSNITGADIWLMTTSDVESANSPMVDGNALSLVTLTDGTQFDGYIPTPYYGIDLGPISTSNALPNPPYAPPTFYYEAVTLTYTGTIGADQYFFAVADDNGTAGLQSNGSRDYKPDDFSPKTTSAVGGPPSVPEPAAFLLFGSGLVGLGFLRRWFKS